MSLSVAMVTMDTADVMTIATWWAEQLGWKLGEDAGEWFASVADPSGSGLIIGFQKVDDPTPGKNKLHFDLTADDRKAEVDRLLTAGATLVGDRSMGDFVWTTLADPDGNQFCVAAQSGS